MKPIAFVKGSEYVRQTLAQEINIKIQQKKTKQQIYLFFQYSIYARMLIREHVINGFCLLPP